MKNYTYVTAASLLLLSACGKTDSSGIYVFSNEREVTMVQLIQSPDGKITGRVQSDVITPDGPVNERSSSVDGAISGNDLILKPSNVLLGGLQASGKVSGSKLTLTGEGFSFTATRSSLEDFQEKVTALKSTAADQNQRAAMMKAEAAQAQAAAEVQTKLAEQAKQVTDRVAHMRSVTAQLSNAINQTPNFAQAAAANTAKVARMASNARRLSDLDRSQLGVAANQVEVDTNQIEVDRNQYEINLNQMVSDITYDANQIDRICGKAPANPLVVPCDSAVTAAREYRVVYERGKARFSPIKAQISAEMAKQERLSRQIDN